MEANGPAGTGPSKTRQAISWVLIGTATVLLVLAIASIWVKRQALDEQYWRDTSSELVENEQIRSTVADYLVDQLFANTDVAGRLQTALPEQLKPLAGPAAGGLRDLATRAANRALADPRVQGVWVEANSITHEQFVRLIEDKGTLVRVTGGAVVLSLAPLVNEIASRAGIGADIGSKLPPDVAQVQVFKADQVDVIQSAVRFLRNLVVVLALLVPILYALAIFLVPGRRRRALLGAGMGILAAGLLVTLVRSIAGDQVVSSLSSTAAIEPTVKATWDIATSLLGDMALYTTLFGIAVIIAAWMAGRSRPATALRRSLAPGLRDRAEMSWGVVAALLLLLLLIVDIPATRQPYGVLLIILLGCLAFWAYRRETLREFPDVESAGFLTSMRDQLRGARRSLGSGRHAAAPSDPYADLERLGALHKSGILTDEEFASQKAAVLAGSMT